MPRAAPQPPDPEPSGRPSGGQGPRTPDRRAWGAAAAVTGAVILAATLTPGDAHLLEPTPLTCLVCGSRGMVDVVLNVLLFLPFGAAVGGLFGRARPALLTGLTLSLGVEAAQLLLVPARDASLSDLVFNSAGAAAGALLALHWRGWLLPAPAAAARLATLATLAWVGTLVATARGLDIRLPAPPYLINAMSGRSAGSVRPYEGTVLRSTVLGVTAPMPARRSAFREYRAPAAPGLPLEAEVEVHAMLPPGMLRPLASLHSRDTTELLALGQRGRALLLRVHTRAAEARFLTPTLALDDALPPAEAIPPGNDRSRGPLVEARGEVTPRELRLSATWGGRTREAAMPRSPLVGWTFFGVFGLRYGRLGPLLTAAWIAAFLVPGAYWAAWAAPRGLAAAACAAVALAAMALVPRWFELATPGRLDWAASVAAVVVGWSLARAMCGVAPRAGRPGRRPGHDR